MSVATPRFTTTRPIYPAEFADHIERLTKASLKALAVGRGRDAASLAAIGDLGALTRVLHEYLVTQSVAYDDQDAPASRGAKVRLASLRKKLLVLDEEVTLRHKIPTKGRLSLK